MWLLALLACGGPQLDASPRGGPADPDPTAYVYYRDEDGDGFGHGDVAERSPVPLDDPGLADNATDCDDAWAPAHPGAAEACDGHDDDCDGAVDLPLPADAPDAWNDDDNDGFGAGSPFPACDVVGVARNDLDCDDADPAAFPGAIEVQGDGRDEDCDGDDDGGLPALALIRAPGAVGDRLAAGDVTGDGVPDLVAREDGSVDVFAGPLVGVRRGRADVVLPFDFPSGGLAVGLLDADGSADVAAGPAVWLGPLVDGAAPTAALDLLPTADVAIADLDGDGTSDIVAAGGEGAGWLSGPYRAPSGELWPMREAYRAAAGDFDGDGAAEALVATTRDDGAAEVVLVSATITSPIPVALGSAPFELLATGDLDGDGYDDALLDPLTSGGDRVLQTLPGGVGGLTMLGPYDAGFEIDVDYGEAWQATGAIREADGEGEAWIAIVAAKPCLFVARGIAEGPTPLSTLPAYDIGEADSFALARDEANAPAGGALLLSLVRQDESFLYVLGDP